MPAPIDSYPGSDAGVTSPASNWAALTPHDSTDFTFLPKSIAVGEVAGSFVAVGMDGTAATFYGAAGQIIPIRPRRINATGLTGGMTFVGLK